MSNKQFTTALPPALKYPNVDDTLKARAKRYGAFTGHAYITQTLKDTIRGHSGWEHLDPDMMEALDMIAHKIGRILNGDPHYADSWHDIAGYAALVDKRLVSGEEV